MRNFLSFFFINIPILSLAIALVWSWILWLMGKGHLGEICTRKVLILAVGVGGLWGAFFKYFFPELVAVTFNWPVTTFQSRMGVADLAFAVTGIGAIWGNYNYCLSISILSFCFFPGLFLDHLQEMFETQSPLFGNIDFLTSFNLLVPAILAVSLYFWSLSRRSRA